MIYLLDTNACIVYLNGRNLNLRRRIECQIDSDIVVCSIVKAELFYGYRGRLLETFPILFFNHRTN